jgi:ABC-2 type transport system permease protein
MTTIAQPLPLSRPHRLPATPALSAVATLVRRRLQLTLRTPRELFVPLLTPILFALLIAPALREALHTGASYEAYVALGTVGLLIPLNAMLSGLGVIVDRESGAQRELLAAPIPRPLLVVANLIVALAIGALQVVVLIAAAVLRGISFNASGSGVLWFAAAALLLGIAMYAVAETLASRVPRPEEYIARVPAIAIVPWFVAGSLFPINALPGALTFLAKLLPLTHALAVARYGLLGDESGLHQIWRMGDATALAALSVAVVGAFAVGLGALAVRSFARAAIK